MRVLILGILTAGLVAPPSHAVDTVTCQGKPATIVQSEGVVEGTGGDDVIVGGHDTEVRARGGADTICVSGGHVDGGPGVDSVELRGIDHEEFSTLTDLEHLDVTTDFGIDAVDLRWTEVPAVLSGSIDGGDSEDLVRARAPERVRLDLQRGRVTLGPGLGLAIGGFENATAVAPRVRLVGDRARNYLRLSGCDLAARGGDGRDRLWLLDKLVAETCRGARLTGQDGNDKLRGGARGDVLLGGRGRDRADGGPGLDTCAAEKEFGCER